MEILLKSRNGDVTESEIGTGCEVIIEQLATLQQIAGRLNDTLAELERSKQKLEVY